MRAAVLIGLFTIGGFFNASADTVRFHAHLAASAEVPPTDSQATGEAMATLDTDTHRLTWEVTFAGFRSLVTMAHFHGPASPGGNAAPQMSLGDTMTSPLRGTATLTGTQQTQLLAGQWYANIHTRNNPAGSIRGQMVKAE